MRHGNMNTTLWTGIFPMSVMAEFFPWLDPNLVFASLCMVTFFICYVLFLKPNGKTVVQHKPRCLPSIPLIGSLLFLPWYDSKSVPGYLMKLANKYGSIFGLYAGSRYLIVVNGRDALEAGFLKQSKNFADRENFFQEKRYTNPNMKGLIFNEFNEEYKVNRTLSLTILKEFGFGNNSVMQNRILLELERLVEAIRLKKGEPFDPRSLAEACVSNVILSILFDRRFDYSDRGLQNLNFYIREFIENMSLVMEMFPVVRHLPSFRNRTKKYKEMNIKLLEWLEVETEEALRRSSGNSFVERYIEKVGTKLDSEQLQFTARDLAFSGIESIATTLRWALVMLADHPHIQDWLQEEIDSVVPRERLPMMDDEPNLPRVRAAILELMRWKSFLPLTPPRRTFWDTEVDGIFIPAGTEVVGNIYSVAMDPKVWPNPEVYRPERFLDEDGQVYGGDRIVPFSLGRRSCFGEALAHQEIFIFVAGIIQQFRILPPDGRTTVASHEHYVGTTLTPTPFEIRMHPRIG